MLKLLYNIKKYYKHYDLMHPLKAKKVSIKDMYNHNTLMGIYENMWMSMEYYKPNTKDYKWLSRLYGELGDYITYSPKLNIKKIMLTTIIATTLISTVWAGAHTLNERAELEANWESTREVITVRVCSGDTLDGFGYEYKPSWMDVREYREQIKDLNDMSTSTLYANTTIKLYVQGE